MQIDLKINGRKRKLDVPAGTTLLEAIRDYAGLTGTKYGCGEGQCGACTVLVDGRALKACVVSARSAAGKNVVTIEGLAPGEGLHPVQKAFLEHAAFQCGFCTPGMILGAVALLDRNPNPTPAEIRSGLQGHICRCGTYPRIVEAVRTAAKSKAPRRG